MLSTMGTHRGQLIGVENLISKLFLIFLLAAFMPHPAVADDKTIPGLINSQGTTAISPQPAGPPPHQHYYYSSETPVVVKAWNTYMNAKWGFSVQYPVALGFDPPALRSHPNAYSEIELPTIYDSGVIRISTYTDQSITAYDNSLVNSDSGGADTFPYPYSLIDLREDLKLAIGSACKKNKNSQIVDLNGIKALRMGMSTGDYESIYFILRNKNLWIEIDVRSYGQTDNLKDTNGDSTSNLRSLKKAAAVSVLNSFKFFNPGDEKAKKIGKKLSTTGTLRGHRASEGL